MNRKQDIYNINIMTYTVVYQYIINSIGTSWLYHNIVTFVKNLKLSSFFRRSGFMEKKDVICLNTYLSVGYVN